MTKGSHKLKAISGVPATVAQAGSVSAAARALGVNRSTVHRWVRAGKVPRPQRHQRPRLNAGHNQTARKQTPEAWARDIRRAYALTATESRLLDLAVTALTISQDAAARPETRLAAMGRFQSLTKQLNFEQEECANGETTTPHAELRSWPRRVG